MRQGSSKAQPFMAGMTMGLLIGVVVVDLIVPIGMVPSVLYVSLVMLALATDNWRLPALAAIAFAGLITYHLVSEYAALEEIPWSVLARTSLVVVAMWLPVGTVLVTRNVEEHKNEERKTLLPVCPSCKQVRDEQGLWHKVEDYLRDECGRDTARGMCPQCRAKWTAGHAYRS